MNIRGYIVISFIFIAMSSSLQGQQLAQWSSFYENGFVWNPALTAKWNYWEASVTHRQEWSGFEDAPRMLTAGFQFPFINRITKSVVGGFISNDRVGPFRHLNVSGTYGYKVRPRWFDNRDDVLTLGFGARIQQFVFDADNLLPFDGSELDPQLLNESSTSVAPNLSLGIFYNSVSDFYTFKSHFYAGLAVNNIVPSTASEISVGAISTVPHINLHAGFRHFPFRKKHYFEPNLLISYAPGKAYHVMGNLRFEQVDQYWLSSGIVSNGEFFLQAGLVFTEDSFMGPLLNGGVLRMGFKADYSIGSIRRYAGMGYEVYMAYLFELE